MTFPEQALAAPLIASWRRVLADQPLLGSILDGSPLWMAMRGSKARERDVFAHEEARHLLQTDYDQLKAYVQETRLDAGPLPELSFNALKDRTWALLPDAARPARVVLDLNRIGRDEEKLRDAWWDAVWEWVRPQTLHAQELITVPDIDPQKLDADRSFFERAGLRPGDVVLEPGVGWGHNAIALAQLGAYVIGVDHSRHLLDKARINAQTYHVAERIELHEAQVTDMPVADHSVDVVFVQNVAGYVLPRFRRKMIAEIARVLRPGGRVLLFDFVSRKGPGHAWWDDQQWFDALRAVGLDYIERWPSQEYQLITLQARRSGPADLHHVQVQAPEFMRDLRRLLDRATFMFAMGLWNPSPEAGSSFRYVVEEIVAYATTLHYWQERYGPAGLDPHDVNLVERLTRREPLAHLPASVWIEQTAELFLEEARHLYSGHSTEEALSDLQERFTASMQALLHNEPRIDYYRLVAA